jgi:hypothetical protein
LRYHFYKAAINTSVDIFNIFFRQQKNKKGTKGRHCFKKDTLSPKKRNHKIMHAQAYLQRLPREPGGTITYDKLGNEIVSRKLKVDADADNENANDQPAKEKRSKHHRKAARELDDDDYNNNHNHQQHHQCSIAGEDCSHEMHYHRYGGDTQTVPAQSHYYPPQHHQHTPLVGGDHQRTGSTAQHPYCSQHCAHYDQQYPHQRQAVADNNYRNSGNTDQDYPCNDQQQYHQDYHQDYPQPEYDAKEEEPRQEKATNRRVVNGAPAKQRDQKQSSSTNAAPANQRSQKQSSAAKVTNKNTATTQHGKAERNAQAQVQTPSVERGNVEETVASSTSCEKQDESNNLAGAPKKAQQQPQQRVLAKKSETKTKSDKRRPSRSPSSSRSTEEHHNRRQQNNRRRHSSHERKNHARPSRKQRHARSHSTGYSTSGSGSGGGSSSSESSSCDCPNCRNDEAERRERLRKANSLTKPVLPRISSNNNNNSRRIINNNNNSNINNNNKNQANPMGAQHATQHITNRDALQQHQHQQNGHHQNGNHRHNADPEPPQHTALKVEGHPCIPPLANGASQSLITRVGVEMLQKFNNQKGNEHFLSKVKNVVMDTVLDKFRSGGANQK